MSQYVRRQTGPHALELTCGNTVEAFSVNDPLIFAEGFYITSEGTSAGEQLAVIREEFSLKIKSLKLASSHSKSRNPYKHSSTSIQNVNECHGLVS